MDYIVNYISDLLANFLMNTGSLQSSASAFPTTLTGAGSTTSEMGSALINYESSNGNKSSLMQTAGTAITSTGTSVSLNADKTYNNMIRNEQVSQAYIESLDDEQLSSLIAKIDNVEIKENDTNKKLILK